MAADDHGFRQIGAIAAGFIARVDLPLGGLVASVVTVAGMVQLVWWRDLDGAGGQRALLNEFCEADTAAQLRALADAVDAAQRRLAK